MSGSVGDEILTEIAKDLQDGARDLIRLLPSSNGEEALHRIAQMQEQLDGLTAAVVGRARYRRVTWASISSILRTSEDTARHRYTERYILRRLTRFARSGSVPESLSGLYSTTSARGPEPPEDSPATTGSADPGVGDTAPSESSKVAYNRLSPVLSMLIRSAQLSNKQVSTKIGCSASFLSRIVTGERVPTWELTQKFARACGADPEVLRAVWESEKLSRKCRDATVTDTNDTPMPAAERLHTAVQTLHIRAGRPAPHDIAVASRWTLDAAAAASVVESAAFPDRPVLTTYVRLLGGDAEYFDRLLDDALGEAKQGSGLLETSTQSNQQAAQNTLTNADRTSTSTSGADRPDPSPAGVDAVLNTFSKVFAEQQTVEDGRARLLQKHANRGRTRPLAALAEALRHYHAPCPQHAP